MPCVWLIASADDDLGRPEWTVVAFAGEEASMPATLPAPHEHDVLVGMSYKVRACVLSIDPDAGTCGSTVGSLHACSYRSAGRLINVRPVAGTVWGH